MPLTRNDVTHPGWCNPALCRVDEFVADHRELPEHLVPADDPEHLLSVGLVRGDEEGPSGWVEHNPEVAISIRGEVAHVALSEVDRLIALLVAARDRGRASQTTRAC